ncbi:hypothetical protein BJ912DRAFT_841947, partial [Pholiota molesta]
MTQGPGIQPGSPIEPDQESNPGEPSSTLSQELASACLELVEKYRTGEVDKIDTLIAIQQILSNHGADEENQAEFVKQALTSYLDMLDNHDAIRGAAANRTTQPARQDEPDIRDGDGDPDTGDAGLPRRGLSPPPGSELGKSKRGRSPSSDDEPDHANPKRRIDPGQFAWVIHEELEPSSLSPELRKTQAMLENFGRDPKIAKASLLNSA